MNSFKNKVQLIGNVGSTPEVKVLENGKKVAQLSLATNEYYKNGEGEKGETTNWHRLVVWGKLIAIVERYIDTGKEIGIEGKLNSRSYEDKEGQIKYVTEIIVSQIMLMGKIKVAS